jgi:hypothetical protein
MQIALGLGIVGAGLLAMKGGCGSGGGRGDGGAADASASVDAFADAIPPTGDASKGDGGVASPFKVLTGALPLYHLPQNIPNAKARNDASGAVFLARQKQLLIVDDGGDDANPDVVPFYLTDVAALFSPPVTMTELPDRTLLPMSLPARHRDTEALATSGHFIYAMSSQPAVAEKADPAFRAFSRFKLHDGQIIDDLTIDPRDAIAAALAQPTTDAWFDAWLLRWRDQKAKDGGINVEAISGTPCEGELLVGLRSPHYGVDYLSPRTDDPTKKQTRTGAAMLVKIDVNDFSAATLDAKVHARLDLGGLGFRGMDYSRAADGYFITAGAVEAGFDYDFFYWDGHPDTAPKRLSALIPEFAKLCRPESVTELEHEGKKYLLVLSEESGAICEQPAAPYNYLLIELDEPFLAALH